MMSQSCIQSRGTRIHQLYYLRKPKKLAAGFDYPERAADDFFDLLGKIDAQRETDSADESSLELDHLAANEQSLTAEGRP